MNEDRQPELKARERIDLVDYACCTHGVGLSLDCTRGCNGTSRELPNGEDVIEHAVRRAEARLIDYIAALGKDLNGTGLVRELRKGAYR